MSQHSYSLEHYRVILEKARDLGYRLPRVEEVAFDRPDERFFLIRHDVDITPWAALTMAELEAEENVTTTYYFRLHATFYNLMDAAVVDLVQKIAALGHEVGLHYEPGYFLDRGTDPIDGTRRDIRTFEELIGRKTRTIAQHQPAEGPLLDEISTDHRCAYQSALVRDIPYFGDSGFHWREGCVCTKLGVHDQLHTLIHPHSWVLGDRPWQEVLRQHAAELGERLRLEMEEYVTSVEAYLANRPQLDREREKRYRERDDKNARKKEAMTQVRVVQAILRRWDPFRLEPGKMAPADEYDSYAPHIVSLVAQGCSVDQLSGYLQQFLTNDVEANPSRDTDFASEIIAALRSEAV